VLLPFVKDDKPIDTRKGAVPNPLEYIKLHGSLDHRLDRDIPLVLSWEQYDEYENNRRNMFHRLTYLSRECPLIFVGYGLGLSRHWGDHAALARAGPASEKRSNR
jgi:hypothetical protein